MNATDTMTYKGFAARVEFDAADDIFVGHIANIDDIVAFHADDAATLRAAFHDAVDDYVATRERVGRTVPSSYPE